MVSTQKCVDNLGGRVIGTAAAWFTISLSGMLPGSASGPAKIAFAAAIVAACYAVVGVVFAFWLPEPKKEMLDET